MSDVQQPTVGQRLTITLAPGQRLALEHIARRNQTTLSFVIRHALARFISQGGDVQLDFSWPEE